jgi:hypothetical protein
MFLKGMYIMGESLGLMTLDKFGNNVINYWVYKKIIISIIFFSSFLVDY